MERITKEHLEMRVGYLNELTAPVQYEIGYRYEHCYLDQKSATHEYCISSTVTAGTKRQVNDTMSAIIDVLRTIKQQ